VPLKQNERRAGGSAETIDRLIRISHGKDVAVFPRQPLQDFYLGEVHVLKLVHQDEPAARPQRRAIVRQQAMSVCDHVPERAQVVFPQHALHRGKHAGDFAAASQNLFVGHFVRIFRPGDAWNRQFPPFEALHVFLIFLRADQFVVAVPHELEQVFEELAHRGGPDEVFQIQLAQAPAQVNPKVLIVDHPELPAVVPEKVVAILMESRNP